MMKNRLFTLAGALALLAVTGKFYAVPAFADAIKTVAATMVQDRDSHARNFYEPWNLNCGYATGICSLDLTPVSAGKRLVIDHMTGFVSNSGPTDLYRISLWIKGSTPVAYIPFNPSHLTFNNLYDSAFSQQIFAVFDAGQTPHIDVQSTGGAFAWQATVSGYMIDVP